MGRTPDRFPGSREEEEIQFETNAPDPTEDGAVRFNGTSFRMKDGTGVFDPRTGSGLSEAAHKALRQLIHFIDEGPAEGFATGAFTVVDPVGPFPTSEIWFVAGSTPPAGKIVEQTVTRNGNKSINTSEWKMYDTDGSTVLVTVTDTFSYSGIFSTGRSRAIA